MIHIFGFYKFKKFSDLRRLKKVFQNIILKNQIRGTIILSKEGINGTISETKKTLSNLKIKSKVYAILKNLTLKITHK